MSEIVPKGWFGPKRVGWGASPRSWQGWLATGIFVAVLTATRIFVVPRLATYFAVRPTIVFAAAFVLELAMFLLLVWTTYDRDAT